MSAPYTLPDLDYGYDALGKYISKDIMELHHSKHHQTYVDKLNGAIEQEPELASKSLPELLKDLDSLPDSVRMTIRNHGGGHFNHTAFWKYLSPDKDQTPSGELAKALDAKYGSYQGFIDEFSKEALAVFGSGWAWLLPDMSIMKTGMQDNPIMYDKPEPILGLDVWEHAYYLDYTYKRADYVDAWWHVANWQEAEQRFATQK
jgi:Fe-Mn family superoxide dismutase